MIGFGSFVKDECRFYEMHQFTNMIYDQERICQEGFGNFIQLCFLGFGTCGMLTA